MTWGVGRAIDLPSWRKTDICGTRNDEDRAVASVRVANIDRDCPKAIQHAAGIGDNDTE